MLASSLLLTACAGSQNSQEGAASASENFDNSDLWEIALVPVSDDYDSASPVCDEPRGNFRVCEFSLEATNITKLPQTVEGIFFLETDDGTVFQEERRSYDGFTGVVNPGETVSQWARFSLPGQGAVAYRMYRAWGATDEPIISHIFEPMWDVSFD
jgi:hypothetical protein